MTSSTRRLLTGSAIVVVAGLCTGLVAYYTAAEPARDARDLAYIPADVSAVAFADVRDIMASGFSERIREVMPTGANRNQLLEETGIDVERDIDSVMAGLAEGGAAAGVVILRGRFDRARIEGLASTHGGRSETYSGRTLLLGLSGGDNAAAQDALSATDVHEPALAFLEPDLLALGDAAAVRRAIDAADRGQAVASDPDMMRFIDRVQASGNAWFVGRASQWLVRASPVPNEVRSQFEAIEWLSVSADIDRDLVGVARAEVRDDESAEQLRTVLAGALAAAKMLGEQDGRLASALSSVHTSGTGRDVELSFTIPASAVDALHAPDGSAAPPAPAAP